MDSDEENESSASQQLEERESDQEAEKLRNEDPTITSVRFRIPQDLLNDHDTFLEITSALQNNRIVHRIQCDIAHPTMPIMRRADNLDLSPLLDVIRTRSQLRFLMLHDWSGSYDISPFLFAAAENPALETLFLHDMAATFSAESLARFQSHPNLRTILISALPFHDKPAILESLKQVIETCPHFDTLHLEGNDNCLVTGDTWRPIGQALCKVQPKLTLAIAFLIFDEDATMLLQDFLHQSPAVVNLSVNCTTFPPLLESSSSSWLPRLLGPSVGAIIVCYSGGDDQADQLTDLRIQEIKLEVKEILKRLNRLEGRNIKTLGFLFFKFEPDYYYDILQTVFDGIPDVLFVSEVTIYYSTESCFSDEFLQQHEHFSPLKKKILDALAKNVSIQKMKLEIAQCKQNVLEWTDVETKQLEFLRLRNKSISHFMAPPNVSQISVWPHYFQAVETTGARLPLVFQCLRGNVDILPVLCEDTDSTYDKLELGQGQSLQQKI
jgi:hypothetical protein